jgi:hypothetical protein
MWNTDYSFVVFRVIFVHKTGRAGGEYGAVLDWAGLSCMYDWDNEG